MKKSRYIISVEASERIYAVNLISRSAMLLSTEAYGFLESVSLKGIPATLNAEEKKLLFDLRNNLFLLDDDFDELSYIRYRTQQERFNHTQFGLVVLPTLNCNFDCPYCFEYKSTDVLSTKNQKRVLQLVAANLSKYHELYVQWFGGEPLLCLNILYDLSKAFLTISEKLHCRYNAMLVTNGELLIPDVTRRLAGLGVHKVQITLDGMRDLHNQTRFSKSGTGSFDRILDNIRFAFEYFEICIRVHVTPHSIDSIHALIDYFSKIKFQEYITELYFAPLFHYQPCISGFLYNQDDKKYMTSSEFALIQTDLLRHAASSGFAIPDFLNASYGICTGVRNNTLVINADGHLFKCYLDVTNPNERTGDLKSGPQFGRNLSKWLNYEFDKDSDCYNCRFFPICLGGCPKQSFGGDSKERVCTSLKYNIEDRIKLYFEYPVADTLNSCSLG